MRSHLSERTLYPLVALLFLCLATMACGSSTTERLSQAASSTEASVPPTEANQQSAAALPTATQQGQTVVAQPTVAQLIITQPTPAPTAPLADPLRVTAQGFGQDGRELGYGVLIQNPNPNMAIENSQYQLAAYGPGGVVVETDSGYIEVVLPGKTLGIGGTIYVDEGVVVERIEAQVSTGRAVLSEPIPDFTVDTIAYQAGDFSSYATGVIHNPYDRDISNLRVSSITYDGANSIIGGGFTYANFVSANGIRGVEVAVTGLQNVSRVEIYPTLSGLSSIREPNVTPDGASPLVLLRHGYGQEENQFSIGFVVQNPNTSFSIEDAQYHATLYSEDGRVLAVEEGYLALLLPGQTLGVATSTRLVVALPVSRLDVQIQSRTYVESEPLAIFTAENIAFQQGQFSSSLTGQIVNPYPRDITNLRVSGLLYDNANNIVGGGFTYLNFVPANGRAAVEVSVTVSGQPVGAELFASVSGLSDIK